MADSYIHRILPLKQALEKKSILLLGPRRCGKSALIHAEIQADAIYDLLESETFRDLSSRPSLIRERLRDKDRLIVIDEIQKLPILMDEVHSLLERRKDLRFVLTGSSARKLRRSHTSLMAGRARTLILHPFSWLEIGNRLSLNRILSRGLLPPVALEEDEDESWHELRDYTGDYLREEILAEAWVRSIERFSSYLTVAAASNGEILNFESIASDAQVPARTVREYYAVLEDTLLGNQVPAFRPGGKADRKSVAKSKFYFFDPGVVNALLGRRSVSDLGPELGGLFETWVHHEIRAYLHYRQRDEGLSFWRNREGQEVDFILGDSAAIEVKASRLVSDKHLQGLAALNEIAPLKRRWVVSRDPRRRKLRMSGPAVEILPWQEFPRALWDGEILGVTELDRSGAERIAQATQSVKSHAYIYLPQPNSGIDDFDTLTVIIEQAGTARFIACNNIAPSDVPHTPDSVSALLNNHNYCWQEGSVSPGQQTVNFFHDQQSNRYVWMGSGQSWGDPGMPPLGYNMMLAASDMYIFEPGHKSSFNLVVTGISMKAGSNPEPYTVREAETLVYDSDIDYPQISEQPIQQ